MKQHRITSLAQKGLGLFGALMISSTAGAALPASSYQTATQALYVAYFGRPADPTGLANFEKALSQANAPTDIPSLSSAYSTNAAVKTLVNSFETSPESQALYGNLSVGQFVDAIYENILGRDPDTSGYNFWTNAISTGQLSQADAALSIMAGALTNTTAAGQLDAELVNNRLAVASFFTSALASQGATSAYAGSSAAASARAMLKEVVATTNVPNFEDSQVQQEIDALQGNVFCGTTWAVFGTGFNHGGSSYQINYIEAIPSSSSTNAGLSIQGRSSATGSLETDAISFAGFTASGSWGTPGGYGMITSMLISGKSMTITGYSGTSSNPASQTLSTVTLTFTGSISFAPGSNSGNINGLTTYPSTSSATGLIIGASNGSTGNATLTCQ